MAADGLTSSSDSDVLSLSKRKISRVSDPRCFTNRPGGDILIASAGRAILARARDTVGIGSTPDPDNDDDCNGWAHSVVDALIGNAFDVKQPPTDATGLAGGFLIGWAGRLWYCGGDQYAEPLTGNEYMAIGSGDMCALGALHVLADDVRLDLLGPDEAVCRAVQAASRWLINMGGTVTVEHAPMPS